VVAEEGTALAAGTVYLAPAGSYLTVVRGPAADLARLVPAPETDSAAAPIDALFRSVAIAYGPAALAVALAPAAGDGPAGAARLRAVGADLLVRGEPGTAWSAAEAIPVEQLSAYVRARLVEPAVAVPAAATPAEPGWRRSAQVTA
jgi:two-component system chemotaxis response regulator CheB